jgi:hypothetical protein
MGDRRFLLHSSALLAYSVLTTDEKEALDKLLASLARRPPERWPAKGVVRLDSPEPLYFLEVDKSLRAFVRPAEGGRPELLDLVRQELLDRYFRGGPVANGTR